MPEVRLIDANALLKECENKGNFYSRIVREFLLTAPTIEAEPVRHGRWIVKGQEIYCSECNEESLYNSFGASKFSRFCPNCGAKMDGKDINVAAKMGGADNG